MEMSAFRSCRLIDLPCGCWLQLPWFLGATALHLHLALHKLPTCDDSLSVKDTPRY